MLNSAPFARLDVSVTFRQEYPKVLIGVFIEHPTPFLPEFFQRLMMLDYPKDKLHVFVHNNVSTVLATDVIPVHGLLIYQCLPDCQEVYHERHMQKFWEEHRNVFGSLKVVGPEENLSQGKARNMAMYVRF